MNTIFIKTKKDVMSPKTQRNILIVIILLLLGLSGFVYHKWDSASTKLNISEQNKSALQDSVRTLKNKKNELEYAKKVLVSKKSELKELNNELHNELKKQKNKTHQLNKVVAEIKSDKDTVIKTKNKLVKHNDSLYSLDWKIDTNYNEHNSLYLKGNSRLTIQNTVDSLRVNPLNTTLTEHKIGIDLISGLRESDDGKIEFFVRSDHPGFEAKEIHSSIIDPESHPVVKKFTKKSGKRFGVGPQVGIGWSGNGNIVPYIGIGVQYDVVQF